MNLRNTTKEMRREKKKGGIREKVNKHGGKKHRSGDN
jgi:hypothetical protein